MTDNPDETLLVELLPCPFCGGEAKTHGPYGWYQQWCISHNCKAFYNGGSEAFKGYPNKAYAISAWNTRAAQSPPPVVSEAPTLADVERQLHALIEASKDRGGMNLHDWVAARMRDAAYRALSTEHLSSPSRGCDAGEDYGPGSPWSEGYNSGFAAGSREPSRGCDLETVEACAKVAESSGPPTEDEIDDAITAWHVGDDDGSLHDFLGWTWAEYAAWVSELEIPARPLSNKAAAAIRNLGKETREGEG